MHIARKMYNIKGDVLTSLLFHFALRCGIRKGGARKNQEGWKVNGTHQLIPVWRVS